MSKHPKEKGQMVYITYAALDDQSLVTDWKPVMRKGPEIFGPRKEWKHRVPLSKRMETLRSRFVEKYRTWSIILNLLSIRCPWYIKTKKCKIERFICQKYSPWNFE